LIPTASVFVNIADKLFIKVGALEFESAKMQSNSGESYTLYTSYFKAFNYVPIIFDMIILVM